MDRLEVEAAVEALTAYAQPWEREGMVGAGGAVERGGGGAGRAGVGGGSTAAVRGRGGRRRV